MKLAVLGGSFNPVHNGHLFLAKQAANEYGYSRIVFIPAYEPPHKHLSAGASDEDRLAMLRAALCECADTRFVCDDCELKRRGTSYTIDTVFDLEARYTGVLDGKIGLIIGSDLAADFSKWKKADLLAEKTDILLGRRLSSDDESTTARTDAALPCNTGCTDEFYSTDGGFPWPHRKLHNDFFSVSSARIRRSIAEKKEWKTLVPQSVYEYIVHRKLYGFQ